MLWMDRLSPSRPAGTKVRGSGQGGDWAGVLQWQWLLQASRDVRYRASSALSRDTGERILLVLLFCCAVCCVLCVVCCVVLGNARRVEAGALQKRGRSGGTSARWWLAFIFKLVRPRCQLHVSRSGRIPCDGGGAGWTEALDGVLRRRPCGCNGTGACTGARPARSVKP